MSLCCSYVPVAMINALTKAPDERIQSMMAGQAWWQELEAAGHMASKPRKQRVTNAGAQAQLALSFLCSVANPAQGMLVPGFR